MRPGPSIKTWTVIQQTAEGSTEPTTVEETLLQYNAYTESVPTQSGLFALDRILVSDYIPWWRLIENKNPGEKHS